MSYIAELIDELGASVFNGDVLYDDDELKNFRDCLKQAKKAGWVFKESNTVCFAPGHKAIEL